MDDVSLTPKQTEALSAALDYVIPPSAERGMPGAGQLGLAARLVRDLAKRDGALEAVSEALARLVGFAEDDCGGFSQLSAEDRRKLVERFDASGGGIAPLLVFPTYIAYYEDPRVLTALGREPRPPHPEGYELEPLDESLLDAVRARGPLYREC